MASTGSRVVELLTEDPSILDGASAEDRGLATRMLRARAIDLDPGPIDPATWAPAVAAPAFGLLLMSGCLARESPAGTQAALEVLCPGDLIRPWDEPALLDERPAQWRALHPSRLAVLDGPFARRATRWPEVAAELLARLMRRHRQATLMLAVRTLPRVEDRVLAVLWLLAERLGHVTTEGITVGLGLRQADLGAIAGARRPTVNVTLKLLRESGLVRHWGTDGYRLDPRAGTIVAASLRGEEYAG